jgi:hypothetical protein
MKKLEGKERPDFAYRKIGIYIEIPPNSANRVYFAGIENIPKAYLYRQVTNTLQVGYRLFVYSQIYKQ